jgi:hypothetical protein
MTVSDCLLASGSIVAVCQEPSSSSSGDGTPTHLSQITTGNIHAYATGNNIILQNLPANAKVDMYNVQGKRVYSNRANPSIGGNGVQAIDVQTKGMYIVKVSSGSTKQVLRVAVR